MKNELDLLKKKALTIKRELAELIKLIKKLQGKERNREIKSPVGIIKTSRTQPVQIENYLRGGYDLLARKPTTEVVR